MLGRAAQYAEAGAQRVAQPSVVRMEKSDDDSRRAKFPQRDPDPSFKFNAVIEEFKGKRRGGHPMLISIGF